MQKHRIFILLLLSILMMPKLVLAKQDSNYSPRQINKVINSRLNKFGENINMGILVEDAKTGKILYTTNANRFYVPASNQKLYTAWTALQILGPNFSYQTQIFIDPSKVQVGQLNDKVYLKFSGDPTFSSAQLNNLISALAKAGIQNINGNIVIDDTAFDQNPNGPGSTVDDGKYCYASPMSTIIVDHNCVSASISPGSKEGGATTLALPPIPQFMNFINQATTGAATTKLCKINVDLKDDNNYVVSGCFPAQANPGSIDMAIKDPRSNIKSLLAYYLQKNNIKLSGQFEFSSLSSPPPLLATESSQPLPKLLTQMLKESDNTIADALFKTSGAKYSSQRGSWKNGSEAMRSVIYKTLNRDIPAATLITGSGSSRYIYHTPEQTVALLRVILASNYADIFIQALPVSGVDGTLKERFQDSTSKGKVLAKTGTMSGISSLSGFLLTQKKHQLVFSIMINGFIDPPAKYQDLEDDICRDLIETA